MATSLHTDLPALCVQIKAAADKELWEETDRLLAAINLALEQCADKLDRATLENTLEAVQFAMSEATRRRNEIGVLVRALGGSTPTADKA